LKVSEVGFGGIPIQRRSVEEGVKVIRKALDLGINFFDTSRSYRDSELKIGRAVEGCRDDVILATGTSRRRKEEVERDLETSLKALGVSKVDIYHISSVNNEETWRMVKQPGGALEAVKEAQQKGLVDFTGITGHRPDFLAELIEGGEFDTVMAPFNFVRDEAKDVLIPMANELDVGVIVIKPLGGGTFTNVVEALKYVLSHEISTTIPGMMTLDEVMEDAKVGILPLILTEEERKRLKELARGLDKTYCRNCRLCLPCPVGINVPAIIRAENWIRRFGFEYWRERFQSSLDRYFECTRCLKCEDGCPYNLPVLDLLSKNVAWVKEAYKHRLT